MNLTTDVTLLILEGAMYLLSLFYTRKEIATRLSILYSANIVATAMSGLIAAATFATLDGAHGLSGWRWLFVIEGAVTFGVASTSMFFLPDHPLTTRWLNADERQLAHSRIAKDTVGLECSKGARAGFMQAIGDPRLWLLTFMQNCHLSATGFNSFFPTVVRTLGFSRTITLVLTCPPYLVSAAACVVTGLSSGKFNERTWHITVGMLVAMSGFIIASATMHVVARYIACFLFASGCYAVNAVILGWVTATLGQTSEKKAASLSIVNMFGNASFIYTPVSSSFSISLQLFDAEVVVANIWFRSTCIQLQTGHDMSLPCQPTPPSPSQRLYVLGL